MPKYKAKGIYVKIVHTSFNVIKMTSLWRLIILCHFILLHFVICWGFQHWFLVRTDSSICCCTWSHWNIWWIMLWYQRFNSLIRIGNLVLSTKLSINLVPFDQNFRHHSWAFICLNLFLLWGQLIAAIRHYCSPITFPLCAASLRELSGVIVSHCGAVAACFGAAVGHYLSAYYNIAWATSIEG